METKYHSASIYKHDIVFDYKGFVKDNANIILQLPVAETLILVI